MRLPASCALLLAASATLAAHGQQPVFSSNVEAVRVDVLVTEGGRPVRGLRATDFEVFDNGVRQRVDFVSTEQLPLNVVLTFDMSDSVVGLRLTHLRGAGRAVLDGLVKGDQAALVTFNNVVAVGAALTPDTAAVRTAIDRAAPDGNTSLVDASFAGMMLGEADVGRGLVIVFSDGLDTASWLKPQAVLGVAKRSDTVVYAVSAGLGAAVDFLRDLTDETGGRLFEVGSTKDLNAVFRQVLEEFRQRYLLSFSPAGVSRDGWHELTVRVKGRNATVRARRGYLAGQDLR